MNTDFEPRLRTALRELADQVDGARLANPALAVRRSARAGSSPAHSWLGLGRGTLAAAAAVVAVIAIAVTVALAGTPARRSAPPAGGGASSTAPWPAQAAPLPKSLSTAAQLPLGPAAAKPTTYVENPVLNSTAAPVLVTPEGSTTLDLPDISRAVPIAARPQGIFVVANSSSFTGGDFDDNYQVLLVSRPGSIRKIFAGSAWGSVVSPDGTRLAITLVNPAKNLSSSAIIDVDSARITHRLDGSYVPVTWADNAVIMTKAENLGTTSNGQQRAANRLVTWPAPFTEQPRALSATDNTAALGLTGRGVLTQLETCLLLSNSNTGQELRRTCSPKGLEVQGPSPDRQHTIVTSADGAAFGLLTPATGVITWWPVTSVFALRWESDDAVLFAGDESNVLVRCRISTMACERAGATWQPTLSSRQELRDQ